MLSRLMFAIVDRRARKGFAEPDSDAGAASPGPSAKVRARRTGIRGETYAYWYLRRHGYIVVARNYMRSGVKGEIDMVGYDGPTLAFVEVKTRAAPEPGKLAPPTPEEAVNDEKQRHLARMARQFLRARRIDSPSYRFDVLAIETRPGARPEVRLHKGAFAPASR
ncbi:MAG TPA: YraN family protein [Candidatus Baltobacteraceae bacterium]|nr:YraN family protein [Candidatus Baltobacteraceae bacterium]